MDRSRIFSRDGFALATALLSIVVVGTALTGGFYARFRSSLDQLATEGAGILAQEALRSFAQNADPEELARIGVGRDSMVTRVRIITGQSVSGAFTVLVDHIDAATYRIKSTGRLETRHGPVICSVDLRWRPVQPQERLRVSPAVQPVCNGSPTRSMILVRAHEVES